MAVQGDIQMALNYVTCGFACGTHTLGTKTMWKIRELALYCHFFVQKPFLNVGPLLSWTRSAEDQRNTCLVNVCHVPDTVLSDKHVSTHLILTKPCKVRTTITSFVQLRKPKHADSRWATHVMQISNLHSLSLGPIFFSNMLHYSCRGHLMFKESMGLTKLKIL